MLGTIFLFDLLDFIANKEKKANVYFSKAGNTFTGFVAFVEKDRTISSLKIASFYDDKTKANQTIAKDLHDFIADKMKEHDIIQWEADFENPANKTYVKAMATWFPDLKMNRSKNKYGRFVYQITKA
jgi:hypothetical protein